MSQLRNGSQFNSSFLRPVVYLVAINCSEVLSSVSIVTTRSVEPRHKDRERDLSIVLVTIDGGSLSIHKEKALFLFMHRGYIQAHKRPNPHINTVCGLITYLIMCLAKYILK